MKIITNKIIIIIILNLYDISEVLQEEKTFVQHKLAALVASKVYYHLGSFEDSLTYALASEELFDVNARNEYVDTIIGKIIFIYYLTMKFLM